MLISSLTLQAQKKIKFKNISEIRSGAIYKIGKNQVPEFLQFENLENLEHVQFKYMDAEVLEKLSEAKNLETLKINRAEIEFLKESVCEFQNLETLDLSSNPISSLPACLCDLKNLKHLILWDTQVASFDDCFSEMDLRTLDLKGVVINYDEYNLLLQLFEERILTTEEPCDCEFKND